ncbi:MAG: hypothetical protein MK110_12365 [Fuerstiella sp.]|nr:hypothetical protein [Fuerstiella sp.]
MRTNRQVRNLFTSVAVFQATFAAWASFTGLLLTSSDSKAEMPFHPTAGERQLFLDDVGIQKIENLKRTMHQPVKKGAVIRPNWQLGVSSVQVRTAPVWDAEQQIFKFWDCAATPPDLTATGKNYTGYYESPDGLHWSQPELGQVTYERWPRNNYISLMAGEHHVRTDYVIHDPTDPDPSRRYKCALPPVGFAVSPDGRRWKMLPDVPGVPSGDEANFSFDEKAGLLILTVKRNGPNGRSVYLETSRDFKMWTDHGLIFHTDDLDQKMGLDRIRTRLADDSLQPVMSIDPTRYNVDVYNMGVFRYESLYVGMPTMYYSTGPSVDGTNTDGFHLVQLTCSRDLKNWQRLGDRRPFIDSSRPGDGAYDLTGIIGPSNAVLRGEELWFYYTSAKYRTRPPRPDPDACAISLAVLRRDGFVSLDAGETKGTILTKPFRMTGTKLFLNADAPRGEIWVEVLDSNGAVLTRSKPVTGNVMHEQVHWQQSDIARFEDQTVQLRYLIRNGRFYSYWTE